MRRLSSHAENTSDLTNLEGWTALEEVRNLTFSVVH